MFYASIFLTFLEIFDIIYIENEKGSNKMFPTLAERQAAMNFVHDLFENDFYDAISYHQNECGGYIVGFMDWVNSHNSFFDNVEASFYHGASKVCIVIPELADKWVIKMSFLRKTNPNYEDSADDYCLREANYFKEACEAHLNEFFAGSYAIGTVKEAVVCLQEFAHPDPDMFETIMYDRIEETPERFGICKESYDSEEEYLDEVRTTISWLSEEEEVSTILGDGHDELIKFIEDHRINDLHSGNWGITSDGRFVIFDYSGYEG